MSGPGADKHPASKCIICLEGVALRKEPSEESLANLKEYTAKRVSFGETKYRPLLDRLKHVPDKEYPSAKHYFHYSCYKDVVHKEKLQRASKRYFAALSSGVPVVPPKKGRPSTSSHNEMMIKPGGRIHRSVDNSKPKQCIFQCMDPCSGELHCIESETMGQKILNIKENTSNETLKVVLAKINSPLDCVAFDMVYHRDCLREQERKLEQVTSNISDPSTVSKIVADIDILNAVRSSLSLGRIITMNDINDEYCDILKDHGIETSGSDHKKHIKELIITNIDDAEFIKSHRKYESEQVIHKQKLGEAVNEIRECQSETDFKSVECISKAAAILRQEIAALEKWSFTGSLTDFVVPPKLASFIKWLVIGTKNSEVKGKRSEDCHKMVNIISQQIIYNFKTDRQVRYEPKVDSSFRNRSETPLSVGLALTVHKKTRSKNLVSTMSRLQLGVNYTDTVGIEKRISYGVAQRMERTGGFCLPPFIKKGKSLYFAVDNIDFLENTADGQNTLHGTLLVVNQAEDANAIAVNEPIIIPQKVEPVNININYLDAKKLESNAITFDEVAFDSFHDITKTYEAYDLAWFMACSFNKKECSDTSISQPDTQLQVEHCDKLPDDKIRRNDIMPTWSASNSLLMQGKGQCGHQQKTNSGIVAPLLRRPPTDYNALYTALCTAQGISAFVVGPHCKTVITLDLDLYERAIKLQSTTGNTNWVLRVGELHACFASLHAIAKYIEGSGLDAISIEAGIYSPATIRQIFTGKWYKRGIEYHITTVLACYELLFEALQQVHSIDDQVKKCNELRENLHNRTDSSMIFDDICSFFDQEYLAKVNAINGEMAQFLKNYMRQVGCLLHLVRSCRQGDWQHYLVSLEEQVKYYFAHDLYKYARLVPLHLAQMRSLQTSDPETWMDLQNGDFVVKKSGVPFTNLFVDQTLEQKIREIKVTGGITGITQDEDTLNRFFLIAPEVTRIVKDFQRNYSIGDMSSSKTEHYQLTGSMALRIHQNAAKIKSGIIEHCRGNPFIEQTQLMNIVSCMVIPDVAKADILLRDSKGEAVFESFVSKRLITSSAEKSIWDPIQKMKLKTFTSCQKKTVCKIGTKLVKLREDRQLLARFLVVQQSRPGLISSLGETIGKYEFSVIPRSLFSSDGALLIPTDKSSFFGVIEQYSQGNESGAEQTSHAKRDHVCIIDAMSIVHTIKKGPKMATCSDFAQTFVEIISSMLDGYSEGRIIFDRYIKDSLKAQTRGKRAGGVDPVKFIITDSTNIKLVPLTTLLSHIETKAQLTQYLGKAVLRAFANSTKNIIVTYGTTTYANNPGLFDLRFTEHNHEEADTLIPLHIIDVVANGRELRDIDVVSPDTDVFILLIDVYVHAQLKCELCLITGKGANKRKINIKERCLAIGIEKSRGLLGLHHFSGADWGGKFVGISKKRWLTSYLRIDSGSPVISALMGLGEEGIDLKCTVEVLEGFVCEVYAKTSKLRKIDALRWELFQTKNLEGERLPPTLGSLVPHVRRVNLIVTISKGYRQPQLPIPPLQENGWEKNTEGSIVPVKCLELPAPQAVIELVKCSCTGQCSGQRRCSCLKNNLPCTALCKCNDCRNTTDYNAESDPDDTEEID